MSRRKSMSSTTIRNKSNKTSSSALAPIPLSKKPSCAPSSAKGGSKTACIRTFGCQMNVHDSDRMRRMIRDAGYAEVQRYEDADLVVLNTCYVRENAVDRVKGHLGELSRLKKEGRVSKVAITGCNYVCSYCVVPSVRGRMACRPMENVLGEVRRLVNGGTRYVTLLGQTVDAWREDGTKFCD